MDPQRTQFARATSVSVNEHGAGAGAGSADRRFTATVEPGWDVAGNPNGGYLLATVARALVAATGRPDPISVTGHFLQPASPGPVHVDVGDLRAGRRYATARAVLAGDAPVLAAIGTCGDLGESGAGSSSDVHLLDASPPWMPDPEDCTPISPGDPFVPPLMSKVELRLHPDDAGFATGAPSGAPLVRGWFRLPAEEHVDAVALICALDAFPPTVFNAALPVAWCPTLALTVHVRSRPGTGWLACSFRTKLVSGGTVEIDGEAWDGPTLVAQSRQLALVPDSVG